VPRVYRDRERERERRRRRVLLRRERLLAEASSVSKRGNPAIMTVSFIGRRLSAALAQGNIVPSSRNKLSILLPPEHQAEFNLLLILEDRPEG
jgi:hypothetical protein